MATVFQQKVWEMTSKVPRGRVTTYAAIAHALGTGAYRAVGQALNKNPSHMQTPCHRVVGSDGSLGGWAWGTEGKVVALKAEGIEVLDGKVVNFEKVVVKNLL
jgi:methylated-DNA-[protein]-cysteine S-methyltransferase